MPKYDQARKTLSKACEQYVSHNQAQLNALQPTSPYLYNDSFFFCALKDSYSSGFFDWMACKYYYWLGGIIRLDCPLNRVERYEKFFPTHILQPQFYPDSNEVRRKPEVYDKVTLDSIMLDRVTALAELLSHIMVNVKKEPDFNKNLNDFKSKHESDYLCSENDNLCSDNDPLSIKIYKALNNLRALVNLVATIPEYKLKTPRHSINEAFPILEGYLKGLAVKELKAILDDTTLNDEDSVKLVASRLKNKTTLDILGKNRQSQTEQILKILSVALIAIGIGIIPTVILAAKRLYDTGGTSINFFKPLSKNLCEDAEDITAQLDLDRQVI